MQKQYPQHYRTEWERNEVFKDWIQKVDNKPTKAKCIFCKQVLNAKFFDLMKHVNTVKHTKAAKPFSSSRQKKLLFVPEKVNLESKKSQAALCLFVAEHSSIMSIDHLSVLCRNRFKDSDGATNLNIKRTKCTSVIRNVIGPHFVSELRDDLGDGDYSLIIDESTDIAVTKKLGVVIRYFSLRNLCVISTFLGLVELKNGTADAIVEAVGQLLSSININKKKLISLGTDNASVMTGINNRVHAKIKKNWNLPNLILIRCTCHSLQLALSSASEMTLPRNLEFVLREIYNWFSCSTKRQEEYYNIYKLINDDKYPIKFPKTVNTRWISIEPAVAAIVSHWDELKLHFNLVRQNCYTSELIFSMLNDPINFCYFVYLKSILNDFKKLMKSFESETADPAKLLDNLVRLVTCLSSRIVNSRHKIDIFSVKLEDYLDPSPFLIYEFNNALSSSKIGPQSCNAIKKRCIDFTLKLINEITNRLPNNVSVLKKMNSFAIDNCLKPVKSPEIIVQLAEEMGIAAHKIDSTVNQWNNVHTVNWTCKTDTCKFWSEVRSYRDASGLNPYEDLVSLALKLLILPHSNAEVERVFSQMNLVKNKMRNKMHTKTLNAILYIRSGLRQNKTVCGDYVFPEQVLKKIGTKNSYEEEDDCDLDCEYCDF